MIVGFGREDASAGGYPSRGAGEEVYVCGIYACLVFLKGERKGDRTFGNVGEDLDSGGADADDCYSFSTPIVRSVPIR